MTVFLSFKSLSNELKSSCKISYSRSFSYLCCSRFIINS